MPDTVLDAGDLKKKKKKSTRERQSLCFHGAYTLLEGDTYLCPPHPHFPFCQVAISTVMKKCLRQECNSWKQAGYSAGNRQGLFSLWFPAKKYGLGRYGIGQK